MAPWQRLPSGIKLAKAIPWVGAAIGIMAIYYSVGSTDHANRAEPNSPRATPLAAASVNAALGAEESLTLEPESVPLSRPPAAAPRGAFVRAVSFDALSIAEKSVLKQLWAIHDYYGETPGRVIAFQVGASSPRWAEFSEGRDELLTRGWVTVVTSGGVALNGEGRAFASVHEDEINRYPFSFRPPDRTLGSRVAEGFASLSAAEKLLLKKLWALETGGKPTRGRHLALNVAPEAPGFGKFSLGRDRLLAKGWVGVGAQNGAVFLRPAGRTFCELNRDEIALFPGREGASMPGE